jgi:hypothetical protein
MHLITIITVRNIRYTYDSENRITGYVRDFDDPDSVDYGRMSLERYNVDDYLGSALHAAQSGNGQDEIPTLASTVVDILQTENCTDYVVRGSERSHDYIASYKYIQADGSGTETTAHLEGFTETEFHDIFAALAAWTGNKSGA